MDLELNADERALADAVRKLCDGRFPIETVRRLEHGGGLERGAWRELAQAGVFSLRLPEDEGGAGLGMAESVVVFEELGRALVPGPLLFSQLASGLVEGCAEGDTIVGGLERPAVGQLAEPVVIEHLESLDTLVVVDDDGIWQVDPADLDAAPLAEPFDPLTPVHLAPSLPRGEQLASAEEASAWRLQGTTLAAAMLLGIAEATTDAAVAYAKERHQFDRPIGSFQAVKHVLADCLVRTEVARAATYAAGVTLDDAAAAGKARAVSAAKIEAAEAALRNGKASVQVHGGMGFTWEVPAHLYLKRARVLETSFGSSDAHAETMASLLPV